MDIVIVAIGVFLLLWLLTWRLVTEKTTYGKSVYMDRGYATRVLESRTHGIRCKPDSIEAMSDGELALIELKNRAYPRLYPSDEAQIIASVIAARESGFDIRRAMLEVCSGQRLEVPVSDDEGRLLECIAAPLEAARVVARGEVPKALPSRSKCRSCGFLNQCEFGV